MRVLVVGGGAAGLAAAIFAARTGAEVLLLEKNGQCGSKLLATGGGRCNATNLRPPGEWPALFGRHGRFVSPALAFMPRERLLDWFAELGQPLASPDGFHLFPESDSARAVRDALLDAARRSGVAIRTGARVERILTPGDGAGIAGLAVSGGDERCDRAVLATGGRSWPATGSTWDGCRMAAEIGHAVRPAFPGLVGLRADNLDPDLAGLVLPDAVVTFRGKGGRTLRGEGELLLTHGGVSGPAVLDLSASVCQALEAADGGGAEVRVCWRGGMGRREWLDEFAGWRRERGASRVAALVREHLPQRLARWLCAAAGVEAGTTAATLTAAGREALAGALSGFTVRVAGHEGWDKAMITRGGVDVRQVAAETMESRLLAGLYFAGETLDMDGPCGGYNLHWAFASGALAGVSAGTPG